MDLNGKERSSSWTPLAGAPQGSREPPPPLPAPAFSCPDVLVLYCFTSPHLLFWSWHLSPFGHVLIRTDCNKRMFMYSITLCCASLLSPSMIGIQRCRLKLNRRPQQSFRGWSGTLVYALPRSVLSFALNYWYLFAWILSGFQMCVHIFYIPVRRGVRASPCGRLGQRGGLRALCCARVWLQWSRQNKLSAAWLVWVFCGK